MIKWYKKVVFENYANFKGRARRSEYWYFGLAGLCILISFLVIGGLIGAILNGKVGAGNGIALGYICFTVYSLAVMIPNLAVLVRRLHDIGKSGWFFLIAFIPFGAIVLLVFLATEGTRGSNQYGTDPKNQFEEINEIGIE
ncbi:DUF805 domain-containing protein [Flavobacterium sp. KJJ]|uniref:DUF805 domain-containing protein n=1 Tax=Flavobacterium sp. KJJ TaxID=1270193 RepID=UPI00049309DA|nr:DUF805 domain-containing protein [Flavobacterium sp. KJJ]